MQSRSPLFEEFKTMQWSRMIKERNNLGATASMCISLTHGRALGAGVIRDAGPVQRGVEWTQRRRQCHNQPRIRVLHTRMRDSGQTMGKHYQGSRIVDIFHFIYLHNYQLWTFILHHPGIPCRKKCIFTSLVLCL